MTEFFTRTLPIPALPTRNDGYLALEPHHGTMALLERQELQERVDAAPHNVYKMHTA